VNFCVLVIFNSPGANISDLINKIKDDGEEFFISEKEIYLYCPNGFARTKLSNNFFERKLKLTATTRNWKTVKKIIK